MGAPIKITLYDPETSEEKKTYSCLFIPWKLLKKAVKLQSINQESLSDDDIDNIASLVVEAFGDKFSLDELNNGADVGEMMTAITAIVTQASGGSVNPTPPGN